MKWWPSSIAYWRKLSITFKFTTGFCAMLLLVILVALAGYGTFSTVQFKMERAVDISMEIQRLVLEMDVGLRKAHKIELDFFMRWPEIGYSKAKTKYLPTHQAQIKEVVQLSAQLKKVLSESTVSEALRQSRVKFILFLKAEERSVSFEEAVGVYLNAANRSKMVFAETDRIVSELGAAENGAMRQLAETAQRLSRTIKPLGYEDLLNTYQRMRLFEKDYLITRNRSYLTMALASAGKLQLALNRPDIYNRSAKRAAQTDLARYIEIAEKISWLDREIVRLQNEFKLLLKLTDPISKALINLAKEEVENARKQIGIFGHRASSFLLASVLGALIFTILIAVLLNNSITRQVIRLTRVAKKMQHDQLDTPIDIDSEDEIGDLAKSFSAMANRIKELVGDLENQKNMAQSHLHEAIESISEGFCLYDASDRLVLSNSKFRELLGGLADQIVPGISFESMLRMGVAQGIINIDPKDSEAWIEKRLALHRNPRESITLQLKDGRWLQINEYKTRKQEIVGIYTDITDKKQADDHIKQTKEYLENVIESSADAISIVDNNNQFINWNRTAQRLFGYSQKEIKTVAPFELFADHDKFVEIIDQLKQNGFVRQLEVRLKKKDGSVFPAEISIAALRDQHHAVIGSVTVARDLSELYKALKAAQESEQLKTYFLSTVSHELRTPLTSVLGFAKIIKSKYLKELTSQQKKYDPKSKRIIKKISENIAIIESESERLTALINDVLDIAKMEAGDIVWNMRPHSIKAIVEKAAMAVSALFINRDLHLQMRIADGLPNIICDQDRIMQVLINLISNAVKFTVKGSVTCRAYRSGGEIEVSVSDTGVGINSEDKEKIFGKFKQAGDSLIDKPQGTGLGLPISKEIVEHHGGSIWVESKKGSGSTFIFTLPVHRPLPIENKVALQEVVHRVADQVEAAVPDPQEKNQRILIVDDEAHVRKYLRQELETEGYVVHAAQDGKEAMVFLNQHKPDLIVLDVLLPGINGFDVAEILKKSPNTSEIPIIILSVAEDKWRGYQVGVERYYLEPVNMSALLNEIGLLI